MMYKYCLAFSLILLINSSSAMEERSISPAVMPNAQPIMPNTQQEINLSIPTTNAEEIRYNRELVALFNQAGALLMSGYLGYQGTRKCSQAFLLGVIAII